MVELTAVSAESNYTDIDLNSTGTTTLLDVATDVQVSGVYLLNGGTSAEADLEVTDGTDTATLSEGAAGANVAFSDATILGAGDSLQITVQTAEGSAQTNTAVVLYAEP